MPEACFLGQYLFTNLKDKFSCHVLIEIFSKISYTKAKKQQLKSCGKVNDVMKRNYIKILLTETHI
jgi:hypothetical protein